MTQIQTFQNSSFKVQCVCVSGEPWFKGKDVAKILGYNNTTQALIKNVDDDDKKKMEESGGPKMGPPDGNERRTVYLNESGLYSLIMRSEKPEAKTFKKWVTSEVLPKIRKTGSYSALGHYSSNDIFWKEVFETASGREDGLHYKVIRYIRTTYPDVQTIAGLGEYQTTDHQRMDGYLKGYVGGQPDIRLIRGLPNGSQDVFAIELKNPSGTGELNKKQTDYHERLLQKCHVKTVVSSKYEEVVIALHEHYKEVLARAQLPAIADIQEEEHDFSTSSNQKFWIRKLKNKTALLKECDKRGIIIDNPMSTLNTKIVEALIVVDSE
jgi:prophage antirepressor-like protein